MSEPVSDEVTKIRAERAERAKLKALGQWPPPAGKPAGKKPAKKKKK